MITIKNTQKTISIDIDKVRSDAHTIITELGYGDFELGIWFTTDATIRKYNKLYRHKDKPTDILSFPYHEHVSPGEKIKVSYDEDKALGDLIISASFVQKLLPLYKVTLQERITTLLIHGICHLLGYSHYDEENDKIMHALEKKLAKKVSKK